MASPDSIEYLSHFNSGPTYGGSIYVEPIGQRSSQECPLLQPSTPQTPPGIRGRELENLYHDEFPKLLSRFFEILGQLPADVPPILRNIASPSKFFSLCRSLALVITGAQLLTPKIGCAIVWLRYAFNTCSRYIALCETIPTPGWPSLCVYAIEDSEDKEAVFTLLEHLFANGSNPRGSADSGFAEVEGLHDDPLHQSLPVGKSTPGADPLLERLGTDVHYSGHDSPVEAMQGVNVSLPFEQEPMGSTGTMPSDSPSEPANADNTLESTSSPTKPSRNSGSLNCPVCSRLFTDQSNKNRHVRTVHKGASSTCKTCGRRYSRSDNLRVHAKAHEENASPSQAEQS
ncbi:MAG: hypothetical protein M1839_006579 [Geoglossum umbratile]|nr:MAG: hypothetical protein M1839_006579 [Geoglossum umbratile]